MKVPSNQNPAVKTFNWVFYTIAQDIQTLSSEILVKIGPQYPLLFVKDRRGGGSFWTNVPRGTKSQVIGQSFA